MGPRASRDDTTLRSGAAKAEVLLATAAGAWEDDADATALLSALAEVGVAAAPAVWDDPSVRWADASLVVVRSTWDYAPRRDQFIDWARRVQRATTIANHADVIAWNTDKRYLSELAGAGIAVVPTSFCAPWDTAGVARSLRSAAAGGEFVVKPSVSAGSRDTGRFGPDELHRAATLSAAIAAGGRTSMVQPYQASVDTLGETGVVCFDGRISHCFNKAPLLERGADPQPGLYTPERVVASTASETQLALAHQALEFVEKRFGSPPLYARVDMVAADDGTPMLLELELTEPAWFLHTDPGSPGRAATAIRSRITR